MNQTEPEILKLVNVSLSDTGWYTCLVGNTMGKDYRTAWLQVNERGMLKNQYKDLVLIRKLL